jgi:hypothetical protein
MPWHVMICGPLERNIACAGFVLSRDQQYWILYCWILCCPEINKRGVLALQRNARAFSLIQQSRLVPLQSLDLQATNGRRHIRVIFVQAWGLFTCATCCVSAPHAAPKTVPRLWRLAAFNASMDETDGATDQSCCCEGHFGRGRFRARSRFRSCHWLSLGAGRADGFFARSPRSESLWPCRQLVRFSEPCSRRWCG